MNSKIKTDGIPVWVTYFLMLIILFGIGMGAPALVGQGVMDGHSISWGGRQLGIAIGSIFAIMYRNQVGYMIVFACHALKETADLIEVLAAPNVAISMVLPFVPFIALELTALWLSFRAAGTQNSTDAGHSN